MSESKKILIIDDDEDLVAGTRVVLEAAGYTVYSAGSKSEGFEKVKAVVPDLIIMDVMMEKMCDGFDLSRQLKTDEKYKRIPILMVTAIKGETGFNFSKVAGDEVWLPVDDYCDKPLKPDELISKIETLLGKR